MNRFRIFTLSLGLIFASAKALFAQLDTIHWIPPMHARDEWGPQFLYLSTPEKDPFTVDIRDGAGNLVQSVSISNAQPYRFDLGSDNATLTLVTEAQLHQPLKGKGLVIEGAKPFYAYFRVRADSGNHAGDLTCKGRAALGTEFRIGHLFQEVDGQDRRANFVGVLATEDSTTVTMSEVAAGTDYRSGGFDFPATAPASVLLQKGESVVFSQYIGDNAFSQPPDGFMGALLKASKPVAVNCGSWLGAPVIFMANDIGIDQIAPFERVGKEYILCKGNGSDILEHPVVIAHVDHTSVWLNDNPSPVAVLNTGEYLKVPTSAYSSYGNLYIRTSEPVFVYQMIGGAASGDDAMRTAGLIFVPPVSCSIPNAVDDIYEPNRIGNMFFDGGLMIVAMKDSTVTVRVDGAAVNLGAAAPVPGIPEFVTYRNLSLFSQSSAPKTLSVVAQGAVQVGMYGRNQPASFAAFFSGFSKTVKADIALTVTGDGVCPDTLAASGWFDGVQWAYEDSIIQYGPDTFLVVYAPGRYVATGYLGVCRRTDFATDTLDIDFESPQFPYTLQNPSCFGYADGQIDFGAPYGGIPPYQYSLDNGKSFTFQNGYPALAAGAYQLIVRDSTGCYNRPLAVDLLQPDSFFVDLVPLQVPDPLKPGGKVIVMGQPNRPVVAAGWSPERTDPCPDCLTYTFYPEESGWVALTVYDSAGCRALDSLFIAVDPRVYVPNAIHPGSFSGNDHFTLFSPDALPIRRLLIYDRWGEKVFEKRDILTNDASAGWDGRFRGKPALPGVYVFVAEVEVMPGRVEMLKGDVTVVGGQ